MTKDNLILRAGGATDAVMFVIRNAFVAATIIDMDGGCLLS